MISMIRKVAPGHLARAILALAAKSGKKTSQPWNRFHQQGSGDVPGERRLPSKPKRC
jgi:hypothetical protein